MDKYIAFDMDSKKTVVFFLLKPSDSKKTVVFFLLKPSCRQFVND